MTDDLTPNPEEEPIAQPPHQQEDPTADEGWVTTRVAAALNVAPRTVRDYIKNGKLVGRSESEGVKRTSYVSIDSLQELLAQRRASSGHDSPAAARRLSEALAAELAAEGPETRGDLAADPLAEEVHGGHAASPRRDELMREAMLRLEARAAEAADLKARLQLTERTESSLREDLARERERADNLQKQLDRERERARRLAAQPWWRRLLGRPPE